MRHDITELVDVLVAIMERERDVAAKRAVVVELALPDGVDRADLARELARRAGARRCGMRRRARA